MKQLFKKLPPFAPDYSGVCSALFELGGVSVIMDASGCTGNYTGYDEPRWYEGAGRVFCSGVREMDAVMGDEERLVNKVNEYLATHNAAFIAILGSPVPMVIGTDYISLAREMEQRFGIPAFAFDTSGMFHYDKGASQAFMEIAKRFLKPSVDKIPNGINLIGTTPLDMGSPENLETLKLVLQERGYRVVSSWSMDTSLASVSASSSAALNLVVSNSGLEAARFMKKALGIPFLAGLPVGQKGTEMLFQRMKSLMDGLQGGAAAYPERSNNFKALVIGEQISANGLRECLKLDFDFQYVNVASFFNLDKEFIEPGDRSLECEADLTRLTEEKRYDLIIGDPLYKDLINLNTETAYLELPHIAVSSKIHWQEKNVIIGQSGYAMISKALKKENRFERNVS